MPKDISKKIKVDYLMFFTNTGKAHKIKAYEVPETARQAKGTPAINFLSVCDGYSISKIYFFRCKHRNASHHISRCIF